MDVQHSYGHCKSCPICQSNDTVKPFFTFHPQYSAGLKRATHVGLNQTELPGNVRKLSKLVCCVEELSRVGKSVLGLEACCLATAVVDVVVDQGRRFYGRILAITRV